MRNRPDQEAGLLFHQNQQLKAKVERLRACLSWGVALDGMRRGNGAATDEVDRWREQARDLLVDDIDSATGTADDQEWEAYSADALREALEDAPDARQEKAE